MSYDFFYRLFTLLPELRPCGISHYIQPNIGSDRLMLMQRLVVCVEEIRQWMNANQLRLNENKTQFIWLGTPHQLSEVQCQKISLRGR